MAKRISAAQILFVRDLETVSIEIAVWAQKVISEDGWTIPDVKLALRNAANQCDRGPIKD